VYFIPWEILILVCFTQLFIAFQIALLVVDMGFSVHGLYPDGVGLWN
jgi:hypothetical protein